MEIEISNDNSNIISSPRFKELVWAGFNLREMIRNHARRLLWGRGYTLHGKDRKLIEKVLENSHGEMFFGAADNLLFEQGHVIITIRKTMGGEVFLTVPTLWGASSVAKVFESEELAVVWERIVFDHANYVMKTVFDRKKTVTSFYHDAGGGALGEVVILGESVKIANSLNIPIEEHHNLGIVPVAFFPNLPKKNFFGDVVGEWYPDDSPSRDGLTTLQHHVEQILEAIEWELKYNITFILANLSPAAQQLMKKDAEWFKQKWNRVVVTNSGMGLNSLPTGTANSNPFTVVQGKPNLEVYANYLNYTIDRAFNTCGYNSPQGTREHGTNKTSGEVSINMQNDLLTTNEKKGIRTYQCNRLLKKVLTVLGKPDGDCRIEIHGMSTLEQVQLTTNVIERFQAGLISRKIAISRLDKISEEEAEEMVKDIEKEEKARNEMEMKQMENKVGKGKPGKKE